MALKKIKQVNQDPVLTNAAKAEHGFATFAHVNVVIDAVNAVEIDNETLAVKVAALEAIVADLESRIVVLETP
jgi:hypothetical protein